MVDARLIAPLPTHLSRQTGALALLPPTLGERRHRGLARRLIPLCGAADVAVMAGCPHPLAVLRADCIEQENAADDDAVLKHVVVIVAPTRGRSALEDQRRHGRFTDAARRLTRRLAQPPERQRGQAPQEISRALLSLFASVLFDLALPFDPLKDLLAAFLKRAKALVQAVLNRFSRCRGVAS